MSIYNLRPYIGNIPLVGGYNLGPYIGGEGAVQRNFTTLQASLSMHYTISAVTLTGDFEVESDFNTIVTGDSLFGSISNSHFIKIDTSTQIQMRIGGTFLNFTTPTMTDGKLHKALMKRVGSTIECFIDGISMGTQVSPNTLIIEFIGAQTSNLAGAWDGILSDVKITDAGTLIRNYAIDEDWTGPSTVLVDAGTDGLNGTAVNIVDTDSENFTFDGTVSPNTWTNDGATTVIEVAGT